MDEIELVESPDMELRPLEDLILEEPSVKRPFVFLWDEKTGGTTFNDWLLASADELKKLRESHISDFGWPNVIGSAFFLKTYEPKKLASIEILSATVDWNIFSVLQCRAPERVPSCFLLLRNPIDRFISYYLERSTRQLEGGALPLRHLTNVSLEDFEAYLESVRMESLGYSGRESGLFCNLENGELCLDMEGLEPSLDPHETLAFRSFGGPQNRLARMLDPPMGRLEVAKGRLKRCVVGLQNEDFSNHLRVLKKFHPWLRQLPVEAQNSYNSRESKWLREHLPESFRKAIGRFNAVDMELYKQGLEQFYRQVAMARATESAPSTWWPIQLQLPKQSWEINWPYFQKAPNSVSLQLSFLFAFLDLRFCMFKVVLYQFLSIKLNKSMVFSF